MSPGHADIVWVVVFDVLLTAQRVHDGRLETLGKFDHLRVRTSANLRRTIASPANYRPADPRAYPIRGSRARRRERPA